MAAQERRAQHVVPDAALQVVTEQRERVLGKIQKQAGCDRAEAEDLLQEVTFKVLKRGASDDVTDWFHYFASAGRNESVSAWRKRATKESQAAKQPRPAWLSGAGGDDAAEVVLMRQRVEDALDALASLPALEREVFWLREVEGLRPREVCGRLGLDARAQRYRYDLAQALVGEFVAARRAEEAEALDGAAEAAGVPTAPAPVLLLGTSVWRRASGFPPPWIGDQVAACVAAAAAFSVVVHFAMVAPPPAVAGDQLGPAATPPSVARADADAGTPASSEARAATDRQARLIPLPGAGSPPRPGGPAGPGGPASGPARVAGNVCTSGPARVCVRTNNEPDWTGDRYEALGMKVEQNVTPTCAYVAANPVVRCRQGKPDYRVKSVPLAPPSEGAVPGGTP